MNGEAGFSEVSAFERANGAGTPSAATPNGNSSKPAQCTTTGAGKTLSGTTFSTAATTAVTDPYLKFTFKVATATRITVQFDAIRSGTGPAQFALWQSVGSTVFGTEAGPVATQFSGATVYPMFPSGTTPFTFDVTQPATTVEVRIYPFAAGAGTGTFRVDNLTVLATPIGP